MPIPDGETINCRSKKSPHCQHGRPIAETSMDPEGDGMAEDGTWDGETVLCDACYIAEGMPTNNANPGLVAWRQGHAGGTAMKDNLPPRTYAEQVLGKAASSEQLDELFRLHAAAHPVVTHDVLAEAEIRGEWRHNIKRTRVEIFDHNPSTFDGPPAATIAQGSTLLSPGDQWNRRRGVTIAFGRALTNLRMEIEGVRHAVAA